MKISLSPSTVLSDLSDDYIIGKEIGQGSFAIVKECQRKVDGKKFAVKVIQKGKLTDCSQVQTEIRILKASSHQHIVRLHEVYETDETLFMVLELVEGGDLHTSISENGPFSEIECLFIFSKIVSAIQYLHSINIVHRDLKLENILISNAAELKVSDFGLSRKLSSHSECMNTSCGTPAYVAPEMIMGADYGPSVDVWSLGIILFTLIFGEYPFKTTEKGSIFESIISGKFEFPHKVNPELEHLIRGLLTVDVANRLTMEQIVTHPWLNSKNLVCPSSPARLARWKSAPTSPVASTLMVK